MNSYDLWIEIASIAVLLFSFIVIIRLFLARHKTAKEEAALIQQVEKRLRDEFVEKQQAFRLHLQKKSQTEAQQALAEMAAAKERQSARQNIAVFQNTALAFKTMASKALGGEYLELFRQPLHAMGEVYPDVPPQDSGALVSDFVALAIKTTGPNAEVDEITEIAAVRFRQCRAVASLHSYVQPGQRQNLDSALEARTEATPLMQEIAESLLCFIGEDDLVSYHISNTLAFFFSCGIPLHATHRKCYDLLFLSAKAWPGFFGEAHLLQLTSAFNIYHPIRQSALGDAFAGGYLFLFEAMELCGLQALESTIFPADVVI